MKRFAFLPALLFSYYIGITQPAYPIAMTRQYVHYTLEKQQKNLLALDGRPDDQLKAGDNEDINLQLTYAATTRIDGLRKSIELDTTLDNNRKITYLRGLGEVLNSFSTSVRNRNTRLVYLPDIVVAWQTAYELDKQNKSIESVIAQNTHAVGSAILQGISFMHNPQLVDARNRLVYKFIEEHPEKTLSALAANPDVPFTDSLVVLQANTNPAGLYNYAQSRNTKFGRSIRQSPNETVKLLVSLANDNNGQLYLPFFDNLKKGNITTDDIKKVVDNDESYFKLLVKTEIDYAGMAAKGDTASSWHKLGQMLHDKGYQPFISEVNDLHESPDATRFRILNTMTAQDLYYLSIVCEPEIYTSSYVGIYNRIWSRMKNPNADTLLAMTNGDHYKKFISMAANYNTLDDFLSRMSKEHATALMTRFVNNLDETGDLEDAVDVASSYASIKNPEIKKLMLGQISRNYDKAVANGNERATRIYHLEKLILASSDSGTNINLSDSLGVQPVYDVANKYLRDSAGRIVLQMFFYGDAGGRGSYNGFRNLYSTAGWKRTDNPEWVQFTSVGTSVPIVLFANRPGDENKMEDETAQQHLIDWMAEHGYETTITVHRGHSYQLKGTVKQLAPSSKVIILGSCGAYHTMDEILQTCPDAYLVASKQTGYGAINVPLFTTIINQLKTGSDINWPSYWTTVRKSLATGMQTEFDDYIPPYKNLGATFINAYNKAETKEEAGAGQ